MPGYPVAPTGLRRQRAALAAALVCAFLGDLWTPRATAATLDESTQRLLEEQGNAVFAVNFVARGKTAQGAAIFTGGVLAGDRPYAVALWREVARGEFEGHRIQLLAAQENGSPALRKLAGTDGNATALGRALATYLGNMERLVGSPLPRFDIVFRLVPSGVRFRHHATHPFEGFARLRLDLLRVEPDDTEPLDTWFDGLFRDFVHEAIHMVWWDRERFPAWREDVDEEAATYAMEHCTSILSRDALPEAYLYFPVGLRELATVSEQATIAEVNRSLLRLGLPSTVTGFHTFAVALHRYLLGLFRARGERPVAADVLPFCQLVCRARLGWQADEVDAIVGKLAEEVAGR